MKRLSCLCLFGVWLLVGCGGKAPPKAPPVTQVKGTVTLDGKPMAGGVVRFNISGHVPKSLEVKEGAFSGEVFVGKNVVDVVWEKDGPPNPMNPETRLKVNAVSDKFLGPNTPFTPEIKESGNADLKFEVTSAR